MRPEDLNGRARDSYNVWRELGLSEQAALDAVVADGLVKRDGFDAAVSAFRELGLTAEEAKAAAVGRAGSEGEARRLWSVSEAVPDWKRLLDQVSDAEIAESLAEEARRKRKSKTKHTGKSGRVVELHEGDR